jgi:hypothetical protein
LWNTKLQDVDDDDDDDDDDDVDGDDDRTHTARCSLNTSNKPDPRTMVQPSNSVHHVRWKERSRKR